MRVLMGMPDPASRGGPKACEPPFVDALRELGVDVVETTFVYGDNLEAITLRTRVSRVARTAWLLRRMVRADDFDVVHLNTSFDTKTVLRDSFTLALLGRSKVPVFLKIHGSDAALLTTGSRPIRMLARYVLRRPGAIGVLSSDQRRDFVTTGVVPVERVHLVRNAVSAPPTDTPSRAMFLAQYRLPPDTPLLLFISRLIPTKGLLDAVRACSVLHQRGRSFVLCCVGDGPARGEAEAEVARLALRDHVRFYGYLPEPEAAAFYRHSEALVFPTHHDEGLPMVLLNALAAGLPIVTTRTRGAIDYLVEPDNCLWVEPHDPEQLADRLDALLADDAMRVAMRAGARETARSFEPTEVALEYLELYEQLAARGAVSMRAGAVRDRMVDSDTERAS